MGVPPLIPSGTILFPARLGYLTINTTKIQLLFGPHKNTYPQLNVDNFLLELS